MSSKFECVIKISGHTFDIAIADLKSNTHLSFGFIFPKISEICKLAANEVIELKTHSFEIFDGRNKWEATQMNQNVIHNSVIYITRKPIPSDPNLRSGPSVTPEVQKHFSNGISRHCSGHSSGPTGTVQRRDYTSKEVNPNYRKNKQILSEQKKLRNCEKNVELFRNTVMAINIGWDLRGGTNSPNWKLVEKTVQSNCKTFNNIKCCGNFYYWAGYYAQKYESINGLLEPFYQKIFDLLKVVHTLDLDQLFSRSNWTARRIRQISANKHFERYFQQNLADIWREKSRNKVLPKKSNDSNRGVTEKKIIKENQSKDVKNKSFSQKKTIFDYDSPQPRVPNCSPQPRVPPKKSPFLSEYRKIKEMVKSKTNTAVNSSDNNNNISIPPKNSTSKSVPKERTDSVLASDLKDLIEEMKDELKSVGEIDIISTNNSFHRKDTTYTSVPKSIPPFTPSINSLIHSSKNFCGFVPNNRTPSMVLLPPKKSISLSDYRKKMENPSDGESDKNSSNIQNTVSSDPRLKRRLESEKNEKSNHNLPNIESMAQKKLKSQTIESIPKPFESKDKIDKNSSDVSIPSDPRLRRRLEMLNNQ